MSTWFTFHYAAQLLISKPLILRVRQLKDTRRDLKLDLKNANDNFISGAADAGNFICKFANDPRSANFFAMNAFLRQISKAIRSLFNGLKNPRQSRVGRYCAKKISMKLQALVLAAWNSPENGNSCGIWIRLRTIKLNNVAVRASLSLSCSFVSEQRDRRTRRSNRRLR